MPGIVIMVVGMPLILTLGPLESSVQQSPPAPNSEKLNRGGEGRGSCNTRDAHAPARG